MRYPSAVGSLLSAALAAERGISKIAIKNFTPEGSLAELLAPIWGKFTPDVVVQGIVDFNEDGRRPTFQLCQFGTCLLPVDSLAEVIMQMAQR